jgi:hypothetical protein
MAGGKEKVQWKNQLTNMVAIVIGVYLAFALTNWQNQRDSDARERKYMESLNLDLEKDSLLLSEGLLAIKKQNLHILKLIEAARGEDFSEDSMKVFVNAMFSQTTFHSSNFTFEALVSSGQVQHIQDVDFLRSLTELYKGRYQDIQDFDNVGLSNLQQRISQFAIYGGSVKAYIHDKSFEVWATMLISLNSQRKELYDKSLTQIALLRRTISKKIK